MIARGKLSSLLGFARRACQCVDSRERRLMNDTKPHPSPTAEEMVLADGLAGVIDRSLERHPPGEIFVYGIHQHVGPGVLERLRERYQAAGWGKVTLREGATGTHLLILTP